MTTQVADSEEIIDAYRTAVQHANGQIFASELQVTFRDGWFTVKDLEGAESRYRKKELMSLTQELLRQPEFHPESVSETAAHAVEESAKLAPVTHHAQEAHAPHEDVPFTKEQAADPAVVSASATLEPTHFPRQQNKYLNEQVAEAKRLIAFPASAATPALKRDVENKAYFRNLRRIFMIVAAAAAVVIVVILLKK